MAVDGYGSAADHAALSGLTVGDPHTQYALPLQGLASARPAQPVRAGTRYLATDTGVESMSDGGAWRENTPRSMLHSGPLFTPTAPQSSAPITEYPTGLSHRAHNNADGSTWPGTGYVQVTTLRYSGGTTGHDRDYQEAVDHGGKVYRRKWSTSGTPAWLPWQQVQFVENSGWIEITSFLNGATTYQAGLGNAWTPRYRRVNGIVYVAGLVNTGATTIPLHVLTLPAGFRPGTGVWMGIQMCSGPSSRRLDIDSAGQFVFREMASGAASTGWHSIAATYVAEN